MWRITLTLILGWIVTPQSYAESYSFDSAVLGDDGKNIDVSLFNKGLQQPGIYHVQVILNGDVMESRDVEFMLLKKKGEDVVEPCLSLVDFKKYGISTDDVKKIDKKGKCVSITEIPGASETFDFSNQQLLLSVPQLYLKPHYEGLEPEELWDDGITAGLLNYVVNVDENNYRYDESKNITSTYIQLNPGVNIGGLHIRNATTLSKQSSEAQKWQSAYTYADYGLYGMKSRLTMGESFTSGDVFDSVPFRGVMLATDAGMIPAGQRDFSPVIRGIARTQARVEVKQNGYTIYSSSVAPGPFALKDVGVLGRSGGELKVTVNESDGTTQTFTVPFQTPAMAVAEGYLDYSVMMGSYRAADPAVRKSPVSQMTAIYGLPGGITLYGGLQGAGHYQAMVLGGGMSLGEWGAISMDMTGSEGRKPGERTENGEAWRLRYSKYIEATNTTLTLGSYQYASRHYNNLSDVLDSWGVGDEDMNTKRLKSNVSLSMNQSLDEAGMLYLNVSKNNYWNSRTHDDSWGGGYSIGLWGASLSLDWSDNMNRSPSGKKESDKVISFLASLPLSRWLGTTASASFQTISHQHGKTSNDVGINGNSINNQLSWNVHQRRDSGEDINDSDNNSAFLSWNGGNGVSSAYYSYNANTRQVGGSFSGGAIVHKKGITLGQPISDTTALVSAPGAAGMGLLGTPGSKTDFRGYAIESSLAPYQENTISLDPLDVPSDADLPQTDVKVIPAQGAIVLAPFKTHLGVKALITFKDEKGHFIPYGAIAGLKDEKTFFITGEEGEVYMTGLPLKGVLAVKWNNGECYSHFDLHNKKPTSGLYTFDVICGPSS